MALDHLPSFPRLKYFTFLDSERTLGWKHITHVTDHCPAVLSISAPSIQLSPMWRGLNITYLSLGNFERGVPVLELTARKIISACPNLRSFECRQLSEMSADYFQFLQEEGQDIPPRITLSSITGLSVSEGTGFRILDSLDAPQLSKLRFFGRDKVDLHPSDVIVITEHETFWKCLKDFTARCHHSLTILVFNHVSEYLRPISGQAPEKFCGLTVKELAFEKPIIDIVFLCPADSTKDIGLPFPYLNRLSFTSCRYLDTKTLSCIITQRRTPVSQSITHLRVDPRYTVRIYLRCSNLSGTTNVLSTLTKREVTL